MVFFIVKEKESRAKESMRMMGLLDASYWLSWLAYYSIQITVISLLAWFTLRFNVFATSSDLYIFLAIRRGFGHVIAFHKVKILRYGRFCDLFLADIPKHCDNRHTCKLHGSSSDVARALI